ncbi:AGAP008171-PA [Anopheles gambiae str. PEST]|uniref:AGAP008171-PA n=1 Tax=Anopheles gambiae TaxID=7165 RepID=A7UUP4_ANOGA|nr:AGAP008171-PA [Anopheles gambiae str. PEST]
MYFSVLVLFIRPTIPLRFHCDGDFICKIWHWRPLDEGAFVLDHIPITHGAIELYNFWTTELSSHFFADFETQRRNIQQMQTALTVIRSPLRSFVLEDNATFYTIDLSKNRLHTLYDSSAGTATLSYPLLADLYLRENKLKHINLDVFRPMESLTRIDLSHNQISVVSGSLVSASLNLLDLSNNRIVEMDCCGWAVPMLYGMDANDNRLRALPKCLEQAFLNVVRLAFDRNQLQPDVMFQFGRLTSLKFLTLTDNKLPYVTLNMSTIPKQLRHLNLSHNKLKHLDVPYAPSKDFHIDVSSNCISSVDWDRVSANLTKLGMGENPLDCSFHSISTRADIRSKLHIHFRYLNVTKLHSDLLDRVKLSNDETLQATIQHSPIQQAYLSSRTNITSLLLLDTNLSDIEIEPHNPKLEILTIMKSRLRCVPDSIKQLAVVLNLMQNKISFLNYSCSSGVEFPSLRVIYLAHNLLTTIGMNDFNGMKLLNILDLSNNSLHSLEGQLRLSSLTDLKLSHNHFTELSCCGWNLSSLTNLDINNNTLQRLPTCMEDALPIVSYLNLVSNVLSNDDNIWDRLASLSQLTLLDLSYNRLTSMVWDNVTLSTRYINLRNNPMKYLNIPMAIDGFNVDMGCTTFDQLEISSRSFNNTLNAIYCIPIRCSWYGELAYSGNPLKCDKIMEECKMCI